MCTILTREPFYLLFRTWYLYFLTELRAVVTCHTRSMYVICCGVIRAAKVNSSHRRLICVKLRADRGQTVAAQMGVMFSSFLIGFLIQYQVVIITRMLCMKLITENSISYLVDHSSQ